MNKKILILGKGFIGERLQKELDCLIDGSMINSFSDTEKLIKKYNPKIIINCIGITGRRNVDDCELEKDATLLANSFIPIILAEICLRNNIKLVHISSGCIFNYGYKKNKPIKENSQDYFFKLFYSRSKIYAERALEALAWDYNILIARIRIPLLNIKHPKNVLDKLIKYKKVIDIANSITYVPDFIRAIKHLIKIDARGVYNVVNKGGLRYPKLMKAYQKYVPEFKFKVISLKKLNLVRTNLILSTKKLEKTGFKVRNINSVLEECVKAYRQST
ncbi:MAG: sugar nucleotide-binding protein [Candidatus Omnitrophica bacterium]|nr:sugar nucleotide-binding protein [Candidatus Omnitrophota bacterium]MBU1924162.1 sugar nucleotide-binding protein [Candidatus Omnitrophota bacterium]